MNLIEWSEINVAAIRMAPATASPAPWIFPIHWTTNASVYKPDTAGGTNQQQIIGTARKYQQMSGISALARQSRSLSS